jgi:hypothetical protein
MSETLKIAAIRVADAVACSRAARVAGGGGPDVGSTP